MLRKTWPKIVTFFGLGMSLAFAQDRPLDNIASRQYQHEVRPRETMQSIRESVHQLLEDQIQRLGYQQKYEVQKAEIIGRNGTSFTFHGLRDQSVHNIKSLEGADILWVEEAQACLTFRSNTRARGALCGGRLEASGRQRIGAGNR